MWVSYIRQLPKPHQHRSTFDRLRPIASRPPKFPKIQYGFGSIFEMAPDSPPAKYAFSSRENSRNLDEVFPIRNFILSSLHSSVIDETLLGLHYMQSAISGIVDDISGILKLALMTSEDFDGRLHTHAIGIKLALGPNLRVCTSLA